jgi:serine/threonine protein kinase
LAEAPQNPSATPAGDPRGTPSRGPRARGAALPTPVPPAGQSSELVNDAVVNGRYRILKNPNRWAVGNAYPAQDLERRESVVLVLPEISPDQGPGFVQRARVEVERTRRLQAGHVITLRDCGILTEGLPYFVIRRVQGNSLLRAVANGGPLAPDLALHVMERLLAHVGEAHAGGVVLGDIRPANIILAERKGQGQLVLPEPEIVDMAFARGLFDGLLPLPEAPVAYRSPESRAGLPLAVGDDVYALGAVLYFTLTGKAPRAQTLDEQRAAPAPSTARPDLGLSAYLDKVVQTALAPRRAERYGGVKPFQDAIQGLRELFSLSDAARGVLQMGSGPSSQVDGFESDPTQEFGRELVEAMASRVLPAPPPPRLDTTIPFDPRALQIEIQRRDALEAATKARAAGTILGGPLAPEFGEGAAPALTASGRPFDTAPAADHQSEDVMTSVNSAAPAAREHHEEHTVRAEHMTFPWEPPEVSPDDVVPVSSRPPTPVPAPVFGPVSSTSPTAMTPAIDGTEVNLPALRPRLSSAPPQVSASAGTSPPSARASLVLLPQAPRTADEAAHVLQAARDHENPFMFAPLRLDAEVRSVNAPPVQPAAPSPRASSEVSFWRGVVFAGVFFALALGLGYLMFHQTEPPPTLVPPPASAEYLPSVSVPVARAAQPAPASAVEPTSAAEPASAAAPVSAAEPASAAAPVSGAAPVSVAAVAAEAAEATPTDEAVAAGAPVVHLVLHLIPENTKIYRVKTGEQLCSGSPCSLTKPRMGPRGFLKVRMVAPGLPDKIDHIPVHQDATYYYDMRPDAAAEDKPSATPASAAPVAPAPASAVVASPAPVSAAPSPPAPASAAPSPPAPANDEPELLQPF